MFIHIEGLIIKKTQNIILGVFNRVGALGFQVRTMLWEHHESIGFSQYLRSTVHEGESGVFRHVGALGLQAQTAMWVNIRSKVNKRCQEDEGVKLMVKLLYYLSRYHQGI